MNIITKANLAAIRRTDDMIHGFRNTTIFSKFDLKSGFHQISVKNEDVEKTAFNTKCGHFEFLVIPIGIRHAPSTFQALMNSILADYIDDFLIVYLDDLFIYSNNFSYTYNVLR